LLVWQGSSAWDVNAEPVEQSQVSQSANRKLPFTQSFGTEAAARPGELGSVLLDAIWTHSWRADDRGSRKKLNGKEYITTAP
jgi:hypothetical protein